MAGIREGYWINYDTWKILPVDEHSQWLRSEVNAKKLGVSPAVMKEASKIEDRDKFMLYVISKAPIMRVRGHGNYVAFEFSSRSKADPFDAIRKYCENNAGPYTELVINNFATRENVAMNYEKFEEAMNEGGPDAILRVAGGKLSFHHSVSSMLKRLAREIAEAK